MNEERYRHLTYDITMAAARTLARLNPQMVLTYVSGRGTDSTERGSLMWARVKGKTENDLLMLPFKAAYMFRPAGIQPLHGIRSKTPWVQAIYVASAPLLSLFNRLAPKYMTTTEQVGRAMIKVAKDGYPRPGAGKRRHQSPLNISGARRSPNPESRGYRREIPASRCRSPRNDGNQR
jgi:hypothetical protein